jgi:Mg2+ and Co2+ transporter CorA
MKRILKIKNAEIQKPNSAEFRRLLNQFKRDVNNSKFQDELTDYLDKIVLDNEKMIDYIVSVNRLFENIEIVDSYEK